MNIAPQDISVIVQGPIIAESHAEAGTARCLSAIREHLPEAEIILSTWKGADGQGLDFDALIENDDPGAVPLPWGPPSNINRQIVSTQSGLKRGGRAYAMKIRTDCLLTSDACLARFNDFPARSDNYLFFQQRILIPEIFSRDPALDAAPFLFHPSDVFQFGRMEDLRQLWDIPRLQANDLVIRAQQPWYFNLYPGSWRCMPEQYIWTAFLEKHGVAASLEGYWQFTLAQAVVSEASIVNNFQIVGHDAMGLQLPRRLTEFWNAHSVYTHGAWTELYRSYCENGGNPSRIRKRLNCLNRRHWMRVLRHLRSLHRNVFFVWKKSR